MTYTQPLIPAVLFIAVLGLLRIRTCKGNRLIIAAVAGLVLISWPPVDWLFSRPLEGGYPVRPIPIAPEPDAIVVFSSAASPPLFERPFPLPDYDTVQRCEFAAWLHRRWPSLPVLVCGGLGKSGTQPVSMTMREWLRRTGIPESQIWTEERSGSTYENALYGAEILRKAGIKHVALVVDGSSMPRAAACLRKQGIRV